MKEVEALPQMMLQQVANECKKGGDDVTNVQIMRKHLESKVISPLRDRGFVGTYPHFRKEKPGCVELISFQTNKYGGSFAVGVSVVFPQNEKKNYVAWDGLSVDELTVWNTNERYGLKGMYDGWFYYRDLYAKYIIAFGRDYIDVREKQAESFVVPKGYKLVQKFDDATAELICDEVNKQLVHAFRWMEKFEKKNL